MKGYRIQSLHFGKREKGWYEEEPDWSNCLINCPIKTVYRSWQRKAAKTWGWLKSCNLIGSLAKRRYFQIRKTRVTFTLPSAWGHFRPGLFSFSLTVVFLLEAFYFWYLISVLARNYTGSNLLKSRFFAARNWINFVG